MGEEAQASVVDLLLAWEVGYLCRKGMLNGLGGCATAQHPPLLSYDVFLSWSPPSLPLKAFQCLSWARWQSKGRSDLGWLHKPDPLWPPLPPSGPWGQEGGVKVATSLAYSSIVIRDLL